MADYTEAQVREALEQAAKAGEAYTYRRASSFLGDRITGEISSRRGDLYDMVRATLENLRRMKVPHA